MLLAEKTVRQARNACKVLANLRRGAAATAPEITFAPAFAKIIAPIVRPVPSADWL
jgi:hypothetical protein